MVSVAAGPFLHRGFKPLVYSIAPFAVLRPLEQIRNDVLHARASVNSSATAGLRLRHHGRDDHTLEDIALMRTMPHMHIHVPVTSLDVAAAVSEMLSARPAYLRLNSRRKVEFDGDATSQPFVRRRGQGVVVCLGRWWVRS